MGKGKRFFLLMVDDDDDDWILTKEALGSNRLACELEIELHRLTDGMELIEYLNERHGGQEGTGSKPDLILLDLNMPRMNGKEALKQIKSSPEHRRIPVVIYTTSGETADVIECYQSGASSFIVKPTSFEDLENLAHELAKYWRCTAELPDK